MTLAWAFFKRDALIAISYRLDFLFQILGRLVLIVIFYFISRAFGEANRAPAGFTGGLFPYILTGIAFADCVSVSMSIFAKQIREGQITGSLEVTLLAPVPLWIVLLYSSLWAYVFSAARLLFYFGVAWLCLGVDFTRANWLSALVVLVLTDVCFMGIGVLFASGVVLFKRGDTATIFFGDLMMFASGALFPIGALPDWAQKIAAVLPFTPALNSMRAALLLGATLPQIGPGLLTLAAFTLVCVAVGFGSFAVSIAAAKRTGTLSQF